MVADVLQGSSLIAALLGGMVALLAPCCVSVMLPAYFASTFRRRRALVAMTFVFAAGVATVILPLALGASWIGSLIQGHHLPVFLAGGVFMIALGLATATGWRLPAPALGLSSRPARGALSVYTLGAFSGTASACCAPVLAGVIALASTVASFVAALSLGLAYVAGMVLPLFAVALLWDRRDWGSSRVLTSRGVRLTVGRHVITVTPASAASGVLLVGMGTLMSVIAVTGPAMDRTGWQGWLSAELDHVSSRATSWLGQVPGWIYAVILIAAAGGLGRMAWRQALGPPPAVPGERPEPSANAASRGLEGDSV